MEGKKFIVWVFAIIMIGAGFLSVTVFSESKPEYGPGVLKSISFPGGGKASYEVDPGNGLIRNFFYEDGKLIEPLKERPSWLVAGKEWVGIGSFTDSQCRPSYIAIKTRKGSPIEYWSWTPPNNYYCIGAYDPACNPPAWYQPCRDQYAVCD